MLCNECFLSIANDNTVSKLMLIYFQRKIMHIIIYHSREQTQEMYSILMQSLFFCFHINESYIESVVINLSKVKYCFLIYIYDKLNKYAQKFH
jgi:hypothetical protein